MSGLLIDPRVNEQRFKVLLISQGCYTHSYPMSHYMAGVWLDHMIDNYSVNKEDLVIIDIYENSLCCQKKN